jgi:hypothetical protein
MIIVSKATRSQGRTETCGRLGQANNLAPLSIDILKKIVQHLFIWAGRNIFLLTFTFTFRQLCKQSRVETRVYTIFPIYSNDIIVKGNIDSLCCPTTDWTTGV